MFRRLLVATVVVLALVSSATAVPAVATTNRVLAHKLIVVVDRNAAPRAEKKLAVLVLISQKGGAPAGAVATPSKPLTVLLDNRGLYRVKVEIASACKGSCDASYRLFGSAGHKLVIVPSCQGKGPGLVCSKVRIVEVY